MHLRRALLILASLDIAAAPGARAQFVLPLLDSPAAAPEPAGQFASQCGTCHSLTPGEQRQGPNLHGVFGRHAGRLPGFAYSSGFAAADWAWDADRLDAWLANPQALVPGAAMPYRQADPAVRRSIITFLQEQR